MIGAERPRLVPTQWFRPGSRRLVLLTRESAFGDAGNFAIRPKLGRASGHMRAPRLSPRLTLVVMRRAMLVYMFGCATSQPLRPPGPAVR